MSATDAPEDAPGPRTRGLRGLWSRLTADREELSADDERQASKAQRATPIGEVVPRRRVRVSGTVRALTVPVETTIPELVAEVTDGTGDLLVVWMGRREIAGIGTGRRILLEGMVGRSGPRLRMFNPRYSLLPGEAADPAEV